MIRRLSLLVMVLGMAFQASAQLPPIDWVSPLGRDHPLAGRIWMPPEGRFATAEEALLKISSARFALVGEKHDNADHHRLQAWLVQRIAARRRPAIALEAIDQGKSAVLADFLGRHPTDAEGLGAALDWKRSGWPDWQHYAPIIRPVLAQGGPVLATIPSRDTMRAIMRRGVAALPPARVRALGIATDLPAKDRAVLERAIIEGHCNQLPPAVIAPMATAQRVKDAAMADALLNGAASPGRDMAVLIAGNGHVRSDHGVPWHLARLAAGAATVAIGLVEVRKDEAEPASYRAAFGVDRLPFDIVWFTPRASDDDPCAKHAEQFRRARERGGETEGR